MIAMWSSNVPFLLHATSGGIFLIPFAASARVRRYRQFWALALGLAVAAGALNVAIELAHQSNRSENILNRDIGAIAALAFTCPVVSAFFAVQFAQRSALTRAAVATAVVAAFVFVAPFFVIIAHCTSGDCL
jgi:fructose-specific phosphotransferase system IIC component